MKIGDDFADGDLNFLTRFLNIIDTELSEVTSLIKNSNDPDSDGLCDYGEYLIGQGFLSIQIYITNTWPLSGVNKNNALYKTPPYIDDVSAISILNAAANYFKHKGEWFDKNISEGSIKNAQKTTDRIEMIVEDKDYTLSNLLAALLDNPKKLTDINFSEILHYIVDWRRHLSSLE